MTRSRIFQRRIGYSRNAISSKNTSQVLFHVSGWVVGSLEILGSPASLVRSIGNGVSDFFRLPYEGLTRGPGAFVSGVSRGTTSFVKHISKGGLQIDACSCSWTFAQQILLSSVPEGQREPVAALINIDFA